MVTNKIAFIENEKIVEIHFWDSKNIYWFFLFIGMFFFSISLVFFNFINLIISFYYWSILGFFYYRANLGSSIHLKLKFDFEKNILSQWFGKQMIWINFIPLTKISKIEFFNDNHNLFDMDTYNISSTRDLDKDIPFIIKIYLDHKNTIELGPFLPIPLYELCILKDKINKRINIITN